MNPDLELAAAFSTITPVVAAPVEYRLYYDELGRGLYMSSSGNPPGNYVLISKEIYDRAIVADLRVSNGECKIIDLGANLTLQLRKSSNGFRVVKNHPAILLQDGEQYTDTEYYARTY